MGLLRESKVYFLRSLFIISISFFSAFHLSFLAHADELEENSIRADSEIGSARSVTVIQVDPSVVQSFTDLMRHIRVSDGSQAIVDRIETMSQNPADAKILHDLQANSEPVSIQVSVHKNEQASIQWLNSRFREMGLSNINFNAVVDSSRPDPYLAKPDEIKKWKWFRYAAGPGIAVAATARQFLMQPLVQEPKDYLIMILPPAAIGLMTTVLEWQFANPTINSKVWAPFFKNGGPVLGRLKNLSVNIAYGLSLWTAGKLAALAPYLWGGATVDFQSPEFFEAVKSAIIGGTLFTIAMGQYQTDLSIENQDRDNIDTKERYKNESIGVAINNAARVGGWVVPGYWDKIAFGVFFAARTWPQLIQTNIRPKLQALDIRRKLFADTAPQQTLRESCLRLVSRLRPPSL